MIPLAVALVMSCHASGHGDDPDQAALRRFPSVPPLIWKALRSRYSLKYTGEREIYRRWGPDVDRHIEYVTRDGFLTRIEFPDNSKYRGQVIAENLRERRHYFPDRNEIEVSSPRPERLFLHAGPARENPRRENSRREGGESALHFVQEHGERIAGFPTELIKIEDSDGNLVQSLNIEPRSGAVLQRLAYDSVGALRASSRFTQLNLQPDIDPNLFVFRRNGARVVTPVDKLKRLAKREHFDVAMLPSSSGFTLDHVNVGDVQGQRVLMSQYVSNKGRLMIFQTAAGVDPDKLQRNAPRGVHTRAVQIENRWYVLVGPLDDSVLDQALAALKDGTSVVRR